MRPTTRRAEIIQGVQTAHATLERVLEKLAALPEPALGGFETTCHALRNYLNVAQGTATLLQEELREYPTRDVHLWLDGLARASELMLATLEELEPSGIPSTPHIKWELVDVGRMAVRFSDHFRQVAEPKSITVDCVVEAVSPIGRTDRIMLASIMESIFSNAVKYTLPGRRVSVAVEDAPAGVLCVVRDQGLGLTPEERAHLFEPGARLSTRPTGGEPSSGYGLVVAKQLADRLGIELWCVSEPGQGCCFGINVPRPSEAAQITLKSP